MRLEVIHAGRIPYDEATLWQERLVEARLRDEAPDRLILCEHPPVITLGRGADRAHVLGSVDALREQGVAVHDTPRGGDVTWHGPGQLVAYPIVQLPAGRQNVRGFVTDVEEVVIRTLKDYNLTAERIEGLRGVWVGNEKIAAVGIRIWRWVTSHGLAINVDPDLAGFNLIVPCGITDRGVTSMARLLKAAPSMENVGMSVIKHVANVFGYDEIAEMSGGEAIRIDQER
jgi:lipoate-protein ligase B